MNATDNLNELHPRTMDHNLVRFKLLMGMLVWSHQAVGVKYHRQLDGIKGMIRFLNFLNFTINFQAGICFITA